MLKGLSASLQEAEVPEFSYCNCSPPPSTDTQKTADKHSAQKFINSK